MGWTTALTRFACWRGRTCSAADVEDMVEGNIYAVRYDRISELVLSGKVELL